MFLGLGSKVTVFLGLGFRVTVAGLRVSRLHCFGVWGYSVSGFELRVKVFLGF